HGAARSLEQGVPEGVIAKQLRLWGTSKDRILHAARRLGGARASSLLTDALETDVAQKSGLGTPERALERLSLKFCAAMSPK
ncbi:MAG: hypothetical protein KDA28_07225, partial [Phycisphaerales bacterium]|nr:hypothetical protein [Phycisphaerales bacterium]